MACKRVNSPFVVWTACLLWITSIFGIAWSLVLFICIGDLLLMTGTELITAFTLLSSLVMVPTNIHLLYNIGHCKQIDNQSSVGGCPLWFCLIWSAAINMAGAGICGYKIFTAGESVRQYLNQGMDEYKKIAKYKRFIDNLQWVLHCCGLNSYRDWFSRDWYDKTRDYEWDPEETKRVYTNQLSAETDSVPLSCCKSGSCISNYLTELGTNSINTCGCQPILYRLVMFSLVIHLFFFVLVGVMQLLLLRKVCKTRGRKPFIREKRTTQGYCTHDIMRARDNFEASSESCQLPPEDSETELLQEKSSRERFHNISRT